ncbi:TPA: hypothetical protein ACGW44_003179, partial [Bacillus toyonensis]
RADFISALFYPSICGSKTPTSKFSKSKEVKWGMKKAPLIKVSFYIEEILNTNQGNKILYYISSMPFI